MTTKTAAPKKSAKAPAIKATRATSTTTQKKQSPKVAKIASAKEVTPRKKKAVAKKKYSNEELHALVAECAYYIAEKQNFTPGMELQNWLQAEQQVIQQYL